MATKMQETETIHLSGMYIYPDMGNLVPATIELSASNYPISIDIDHKQDATSLALFLHAHLPSETIKKLRNKL